MNRFDCYLYLFCYNFTAIRFVVFTDQSPQKMHWREILSIFCVYFINYFTNFICILHLEISQKNQMNCEYKSIEFESHILIIHVFFWVKQLFADLTDIFQKYFREDFLIGLWGSFILDENKVTVSRKHKVITKKCFHKHLYNLP